jgi:hypothetical protein
MFKACCLKSFKWDGIAAGREGEIDGLPTYISGDGTGAAVLIVHDGLGWKFGNARLLADHYAREVRFPFFLSFFFLDFPSRLVG